MIRSDMMQMREIDSFRPTLRSILTSLRMRSLVMNYICHYGLADFLWAYVITHFPCRAADAA